jgi:hypothetical protein
VIQFAVRLLSSCLDMFMQRKPDTEPYLDIPLLGGNITVWLCSHEIPGTKLFSG